VLLAARPDAQITALCNTLTIEFFIIIYSRIMYGYLLDRTSECYQHLR